MNPAPLLLIVGMHRSGTSLLGSLLPACGIAMPGPLIPGDTYNPEGYFERADITALQEQLLIDLERWWPSPRGMQPLPQGWLASRAGQRALDTLIPLLEPDIARQQGPWAIKDPRSSLLLPLWKAACQRLNVPLHLLLAVREPSEVIMSLVRRDQADTGMDPWRAQRLWWQHNAQVLLNSEALPLQVVHYSHWFHLRSADQQLQQLAPELTPAQRLEALQAVKPQHRRSHQMPLAGAIHPSITHFHQHLQRAALHPTGSASLRQWLEQQPMPPAQPPGANTTQPNHPWRYFAELRVGSDPSAVGHCINHWQVHGFSHDDLRHATHLPSAIPAATPEQRLTITKGNHHLLNNANIEAGPAGAARLLKLAAQEHVLDHNRERVGLLRQFGVAAIWLPT